MNKPFSVADLEILRGGFSFTKTPAQLIVEYQKKSVISRSQKQI